MEKIRIWEEMTRKKALTDFHIAARQSLKFPSGKTEMTSLVHVGTYVCGDWTKWLRTKWYGQNGIWTKWYTDKMSLHKMVWTKWYGQNGSKFWSRLQLK